MLRDRRGSIAVQMVLMLTMLIGFVALGTEITNLLLQQRKMQAAADAAAVAAGVTGRTTTQAFNEAVAMVGSYGFVNGSDTVVVTMNRPPSSGTYDSTAVEVIVEKTYTRRLLALFSKNNIKVKVRAIVIPGRRSSGCLLALDPAGSGAVTVRNGASITDTNCEMAANSTSATALILENTAKVFSPVYLRGNYQLGNGASITGTPLVTNGLTNVADPYASVALPTAPACTAQSGSISGTKTLSAGHFCSGMTLNNGANLTLNPGVYFIDGILNLGQNSSILATGGVTLLINSATTVTVSNNVSLSITAPLTGTTAGMALASQRNITGTFAINNNAKMLIEGAIYFPGMTAAISGKAQTTGANCTQLIAYRLDLGSNLAFQANCSATAVKPIGRTQPVLAL